ISHYSEITTPLIELTKKDRSAIFPLTGSELKSFLKLKDAFTTTPLLAHHDPTLLIFLFTDASDFAISGIPHQCDKDGNLHPLAYYSRKLSESEINYSVHDKEMLGIMESQREFRPWLAGSDLPISVISDHKNLEYFMNLQCLNHRQARWALELSEFNFKLSYPPGKDNPANAPSCHADFIPAYADITKEVNWQTLLTPQHMEKLWEAPKASIAAPAMTSSVLPVAPAYKPPIPSARPAPIPHNPSLATLISLDEWNEALSKDDTWREGVHTSKKDWKLVNGSPFFRLRKYVLPELRSHVLYERHDSLLTGHPGHAKTISLVTRDYIWPLLPN